MRLDVVRRGKIGAVVPHEDLARTVCRVTTERWIGSPTENRCCRVFAAFQTKIYDAGANVFKCYERIAALDEPTYLHTVSHIRSMSTIKLADAPLYPAQILFRSTCSNHTKDGRFVVAAYRVS